MVVVGTFNPNHKHTAQDNAWFKVNCHAKQVATIVENCVRRKPSSTPHDIAGHLDKYKYEFIHTSMESVQSNNDPDKSYQKLPWLCSRIRDVESASIAICETIEGGFTFS
ncbi:hypothetical protein CFOL_v3_20146 [Cephalotus follicularis]|uniref:Uncharacterized protein n=1 Tax=Cephalotus follicularis TaxID=3775 RepID=A0A1Q3C9C9_CEPFO|nr:hypothetical protein CFOL_v3_20146 [Cephalotus follicularis]